MACITLTQQLPLISDDLFILKLQDLLDTAVTQDQMRYSTLLNPKLNTLSDDYECVNVTS